MRYQGGKFRFASHIERLALAARGDRRSYVEPFLGGGATLSRNAPAFDRVRGYDVMPDLVLMWRALLAGWVPPSDVTEEEYAALRHAEPSALRGFVGFGCSFGGRWFGGYARNGNGKTLGGNVAAESVRSLLRQAQRMAHAEVGLADFRSVEVTDADVVYADPPYAGTTPYSGVAPFDTEAFWETAEKWAASGAVVLVSEHSAPAPWVRVWSKDTPAYLRGDQSRAFRTESVFTLPDTAYLLEAS